MNRIRTAVIPAAGLGTRMLPATKAVPKELLPVGGQPAIQWVAEEAVAAGIDRCVIVSSLRKPAIAAYFGDDREFACRVDIINQPSPAGLGDAVRLARDFLEGESFAVLLPDEVLLGGAGLLSKMLDHHERTGRSNVSLLRVMPDEIGSYGCAALDQQGVIGAHFVVRGCVEKPDRPNAPSNLALSGRYVLGPDVLSELDLAIPEPFEEVQLTAALDRVARGQGLDGIEVLPVDGRFDVGNWSGWLQANVQVFSTASRQMATAMWTTGDLEPIFPAPRLRQASLAG